jgi:hypothetical protein
MGIFAKETSDSFGFPPAVLDQIQIPEIDLFKFENVFNLFTEMPLHGFAYKIVILIPI